MSDLVADHSCSALAGLKGLDALRLHRFVVGRDRAPSVADVDDLDDLFARLALGTDPHPRNAEDVISRVLAKLPADDARRTERSFLVGEGSQIAAQFPFERRSFRFVVSLGSNEVDLILSASHPQAPSVEVMAWDSTRGGFNYYRTTQTGAWVFGGNSVDASRPDTRGKGPFESHNGGNVVMKELRFPWVHWHSLVPGAAAVDLSLFEGHLDHRWVRLQGDSNGDGTLAGAEVLETAVVMPSIRRWTRRRLDDIRDGREPARLRQLFGHVLATSTVNLVSSPTPSSAVVRGDDVRLPPQFVVDSVTLGGERGDEIPTREGLGLPRPPALAFPSAIYQDLLREFKVELVDGSVVQPGDTFFPFVVPERAFEDVVLTLSLVDLVATERLIAALSLVDFPNAVFSGVREQLLALFDDEASLPADAAAFSEAIAERVRAEADPQVAANFLRVWDAGKGWREVSAELLQTYYDHLTRRMAEEPEDACRDWFRLAESRRREARDMRGMPIFEFDLLLAVSGLEVEHLRMTSEGTVETIGP